jgi:hypothetical protein
MLAPRWSPLLAAVALLVAACAGVVPAAGPAAPEATLTLDGETGPLTLTSCALVNGRLLEEVPDGGAETTLTAVGQLADGRPIRLAVRRGTDRLPPQRFELVELTIGEVERSIETLVAFRGRDDADGTWTEVDAETPTARRAVPGGLVEVDGSRLTVTATAARPSDGRRVQLSIEATCPVELEPAPGTA